MKGRNMEEKYEVRSQQTKFETRDDENSNPEISGYFVRFDDVYTFAEGMTESIDPHAFDNTLEDDIRALGDHDTRLVLGRTTNGTLKLNVDEVGLFGTVSINPKDTQAMDMYQRIKRGDVSQCSFGFEILDEEASYREDGSAHFLIKSVKLWEVSPVTFPAYSATSINATRSKGIEEHKQRQQEAWKVRMMNKLKGANADGTQSVDD